jgi:probable blue pigment (indigoidine) exporter
MKPASSSTPVIVALTAAVVLWGANNVALRQLVVVWPPLFTGSTRFLIAGAILVGLGAGARVLGPFPKPDRARNAQLWRAGAVLAVYIAATNWTLHFIPASQFALHMATSPAWSLAFEPAPPRRLDRIVRWLAVGLTFLGVVTLLWPALRGAGAWYGHLFGMTTGLLWTLYSRETRRVAIGWSGTAASAHTMWRGGLWLLPLALVEVLLAGRLPVLTMRMAGLHMFSTLAGGVLAYALWTWALMRWPVSRVTLFGNLIPITTAAWATTVGERLTPTFGLALALILGGVLLSQVNWAKLFGPSWRPTE